MIPASVVAVIASFTLSTAPCPYAELGATLGCTDRDTHTIYAPTWAPVQKSVILHEKGHAFDYAALDDTERATIAAERHWPTWRSENFADAFAVCWMNNGLHRKMNRNGIRPMGRRDDRLCHMIVKAA